MEIQYYNLIPPLAKSEDFEPLSPGSDDSGVQEEPPRPQRPPRSIDVTKGEENLPIHSYINLVAPPSIASSATPPLPKRQPYLVNPRSPALSSRSTHFQRNSVRQQQKRAGTCKCKASSADMNNSVPTAAEEDVLLVYSRHCPGAVEWAKYLHKLYTELSKHKGKLRVRHLPVEDMADCLLPPHIEAEIAASRLQLVLLSPTLLQFLSKNQNFLLGRLLHPDRIIAIMLGVRDTQITLEHRNSLISFAQWIHLEAKDHDLEFVQTVLYFSTQILQRGNNSKRIQQQQQKLGRSSSNATMSTNNYSRPSESTLFHVHPRRISEDHNRVMVIFEAPQSARAKMKVTLERNQSSNLQNVDIDELKMLNPYNLLVTIPNCCFSVCNVASLRLEIDGINRGCRTIRLESSLSEMDHLLKISLDPVEFMCQAIGVNPMCKDQLDEALAKQFLTNMPRNGFHLLSGQTVNMDAHNANPKDCGEFPTLLHFSACHGLDKLTSVLLDCCGSNDAIQMMNVSEMTPSELAHANGHFELANKLHAIHVNLANKSHVYDYIQQNNYQIPPPPRPVHVKPMKMNVNNNNANHDPFGTLKAAKSQSFTITDLDQDDDDVFIGPGQQVKGDKFGTMKANKAINMREEPLDYRQPKNTSGAASNSSSEELAITDELLKLLEEFQTQNYAPKEMEMLFESWKRKAALRDLKESEILKERTKKYKATSLLLKLFRSQQGQQVVAHSLSDPNIKATKDTKTYRKPSNASDFEPQKAASVGPIAVPNSRNETILEGEITIINEEDMKVFELPNTPQKHSTNKESSNEGISTQILPLSRLSMSSSSSNSPPNPNEEPKSTASKVDQTPTGRPVAEVQPFSEAAVVTSRSSRISPVKEKLDKIRRSLTEPLIQYFQGNAEDEEPQVLNTPKSIAPPIAAAASNKEVKNGVKSKLFDPNEPKSRKPLPPTIVTDM